MADFCKQCSEKLFDRDYKELANLCKAGHMVGVLCEECGPTVVDEKGVCQGKCYHNHGTVVVHMEDL